MRESTAQAPPPASGGSEPPRRGAPAGRRRSLLFATGGVALALVLGLVLFVRTGSGPPDVAPGVGAPAANLLRLDTLGPKSSFTPPDFTLTDQYGRPVSLSQFRGKAVVLSFNDDQCPDVCTLLAQDIVAANRDLGPAAKHIVFLSVNVNPFYPEVRYVRSWTDSHGLGAEPNWIFTTGPVSQLEQVWKRYGIYVQLDMKDRTVVHGTEMFFVNPAGREVAVGEFGTNAASSSLYAHALSQMAVDLLPADERSTVGGPSVPSPTGTNATVGASAPPFSLPLLANPRRTLSSSRLRGRYAVLNFWSSTCTACKQEMPHVEQAYRDLGENVAFVGVDVSNRPGAARDFASRLGATYPLVSDAQGMLAGDYQITGLPFTVILGPRGSVLIRHPGSLTTEQLEYIVKNEDPALSGS